MGYPSKSALVQAVAGAVLFVGGMIVSAMFSESFPYAGWVLSGVTLLGLIVLLAGFAKIIRQDAMKRRN